MKQAHKHFLLKIIISAALIFPYLQSPLHAVEISSKADQSGSLPSAIISVNSKNIILVEKSSQNLLLYRNDGDDVTLVKKYQCSTGQNKGDKLKSGDRKTPEGVYFINRIHKDDQLPARYGVMALVLDFPNCLDKKEGKGGNGIWLHGLDRPLLPYDSKGCIALNNEDITELYGYLKLFTTPVIIEEKISYDTPDEIKRNKEDAMRFLSKWEDSWEGKQLDIYSRCYSQEKFKPDKWSWNRWKKHKQTLNNEYKFIDVDIRDVNILKFDKIFVVSFLQDYESDKFRSLGLKKIFIRRNSDALKIIGEDWIKVNSLYAGSDKRGPSEERKLCRFLNNWITAWENQKIDDYMDCYAASFSYKDMGRHQWKKYKMEINRSNKMIKVSVIKPKIKIDDGRASVTFLQKYLSDSYTDYGSKRLLLQKENGSWKIITEGWETI